LKKTFFVLLLFVVFAASNLFASGFYTELLGGYTTVSMKQVNNDFFSSDAAGNGITNNPLGDAWYVGFDSTYVAPEGLGFHFRIEYIGVMPGEITDTNLTTKFSYQDYQVSPSLLPIMLGVSYTFHGKGNPFTLTAGVYGGIADSIFDYYQHTIDASGLNDANYNAIYEGWGFCSEAVVNANYWFTKNFSFGIDVGYRYATIPALYSDSTVYDSNGNFIMDSGTRLIRQNSQNNNENIATDFSGLIVGINFTYRFDGWWRRQHEEVIEYGW